MGALFRRLDKDGSGQLDDSEFRRFLRSTLKIPIYAISDAEISSLCASLDADQSGAISISEVMDFIGPDVSRQPEQSLACTSESIKTVDSEKLPQPSSARRC